MASVVLYRFIKDKDKMKEMWDARYGEEEFAYGQAPNIYLKEQIEQLPRRKILFPAEGEGRNAVYAATQGWEASAFDISHEGYKKAIALCMKYQVTIDYKVGEFSQLNYEKEDFDALALIYAHFAPQQRREYHQLLGSYVKPGGLIILEGYSQNNIELGKKENVTMGPPNIKMLYTKKLIAEDFHNFEIIELKEEIISLDEGKFHQGKASVIRFVGKKR